MYSPPRRSASSASDCSSLRLSERSSGFEGAAGGSRCVPVAKYRPGERGESGHPGSDSLGSKASSGLERVGGG